MSVWVNLCIAVHCHHENNSACTYVPLLYWVQSHFLTLDMSISWKIPCFKAKKHTFDPLCVETPVLAADTQGSVESLWLNLVGHAYLPISLSANLALQHHKCGAPLLMTYQFGWLRLSWHWHAILLMPFRISCSGAPCVNRQECYNLGVQLYWWSVTTVAGQTAVAKGNTHGSGATSQLHSCSCYDFPSWREPISISSKWELTFHHLLELHHEIPTKLSQGWDLL